MHKLIYGNFLLLLVFFISWFLNLSISYY